MSHTEGLAAKERAEPLVISETYTHDNLVQLTIHKATPTEDQAVLSWDIPEADGSMRRYTERFMMSDLSAAENAALTTLVDGLVAASVAAEAAAEVAAAEALAAAEAAALAEAEAAAAAAAEAAAAVE
jgi:hypothetical protein